VVERVTKVGDTVRRPLQPWSPNVHDLLRHLESKAFPAPRVLGIEGDTEVLTWIDGESGAAGWSMVVPESGLQNWGQFLRTYHDAVAGYRPKPESVWSSGSGICGEGEIVCHGDFGPWNAVWRGDQVVGLIDWDHARPAPPLFDVAYALEYVVPFRSDVASIRDMRYPEPPDRRRRAELFCEGYGIDVPANLVERVAQQQREILHTVEKLASEGVEPQVTWVREGYLDELALRVRLTESLEI
jgi:Phosphotransferase enzyme family